MEKDVKIVEVSDREVPKRSKKNKSGKKLSKSKPTVKSVRVKNPVSPEIESSNEDMVFMNPFYSFEEFLMNQQQPEDDSTKSAPPPGRITFLDPFCNPLFINDLTPSRSYSHGLAQKPNDIR